MQQLSYFMHIFVQSTITVMQKYTFVVNIFSSELFFKMGFKLHSLIITNYSYFIIMRLLGLYKKIFLEIPRNTI